MVLTQHMLCFVISNLQVLHKRTIHLSEYNCSWEAPNMRSVTSAQVILKRPGCGIIPMNTMEVENSCVRQYIVYLWLVGLHYCMADSFLDISSLFWKLFVDKQVSDMGDVENQYGGGEALEAMLSNSVFNYLQTHLRSSY